MKQNIRNIAIIAHVDHGKTTLVDKMLMAGNLFRDNQQTGELMLDNNELERERGITILSKNVSINYKDTKINIIDTPGHSDFGGEVERVLNMADGCLLLVDAFEGPMPQTRFVLQKALQIGLKPIVVINKVDKPNCRPEEVYEMVFDLMCDLDATEEQLDFPVIYGSAKQGWMGEDWQTPTGDIYYLLDQILEHIPAPEQLDGTPQMLITSLDYSTYTGRIAVGRVHRGTLREGMAITIVHRDGSKERTKIKELHTFTGMGHQKTDAVSSGDICAIIGLSNFEIGDTICDAEEPEALPTISIDEPTMSMLFTINDSPFFGKEGKWCTSRHIHERLQKELEKNLALRVEQAPDSTDRWIVSGRGVLHLSVLIETMRREGYELQVGQPQVIYKYVPVDQLTSEQVNKLIPEAFNSSTNNSSTRQLVKCEPIEELTINVPEEFSSKMIDMVTRRKGEMTSMESQGDRVNIEFLIPSRGIIGLVNKGQPRKPDDWGSLRAWAWGAARGLDYLETDPDVDAKHVGIEGVSRYGKAALVTLAFEDRFYMGLIGSSGKGGATLHRRFYGEGLENLANSGEYHWMGTSTAAGRLPLPRARCSSCSAPRTSVYPMTIARSPCRLYSPAFSTASWHGASTTAAIPTALT